MKIGKNIGYHKKKPKRNFEILNCYIVFLIAYLRTQFGLNIVTMNIQGHIFLFFSKTQTRIEHFGFLNGNRTSPVALRFPEKHRISKKS